MGLKYTLEILENGGGLRRQGSCTEWGVGWCLVSPSLPSTTGNPS